MTKFLQITLFLVGLACIQAAPAEEVTTPSTTTTSELITLSSVEPDTTPSDDGSDPTDTTPTDGSITVGPVPADGSDTKPAPENPEAVEAYADYAGGLIEFTFNMLAKQYANAKDENIIFSPYGVSDAFGMVAQGAKGNTEKEIVDAFHYPTPNERLQAAFKQYRRLQASLGGGEGLLVANTAFLSKALSIVPEFNATIADVFNATYSSIDFQETKAAVDTINKWVATQTMEKIQRIVTLSDIRPETAFAVLNAIYFRGVWQQKFDKANNVMATFHGSSKTKENQIAEYMRLNSTFRFTHSNELQSDVLELEYQNGSYSLVIIVPNVGQLTVVYGVKELIEQKLTKKAFLEVLAQLDQPESRVPLALALPKFNISADIDLVETLAALGIHDAFDNKANFSGIVGKQPVSISKVKQVATIEVDEKGSVATAATAIIGRTRSMMIPPIYKPFAVNKSFLFALVEKTEPAATIIFTGVFDNSQLLHSLETLAELN